MTDWGLRDELAKEMVRRASLSVLMAVDSLLEVERTTGDNRFEALVTELHDVRQRIWETAGRE